MSASPDDMKNGLPKVERKGILTLHRCGVPINKDDSSQSSSTRTSPPVYVLLSGFPDPSTTFDDYVKPLESNYHIVKIALPGMDDSESIPFWGYSLSRITNNLIQVLQDYRNECKASIIYLHGFDWGALITLSVVHLQPQLVTKLIQQDIGLGVTQTNLWNQIRIGSYFSWLAGWFFVSRILVFLGNEALAHRVLSPLVRYGYPWPKFIPAWFWEVYRPSKGYAYFRIVVDGVQGQLVTPKLVPSVPHYFGFGARKGGVMYHSLQYLNKLDKTPNCHWKEYKQAGHWIHHDCPDEFRSDVQAFLEAPLDETTIHSKVE